MIDPQLLPIAAHARDAAVLLDYDGSLAAIVDDPEAARPVPGALDALRVLAGSVGELAVVSGRPISYLVAALPVDGLTLVGQYGLERLVDGRVVEDPVAAAHVGAVARAAAEAERAFPWLYVERKGRLTVTLHWRARPGAGGDVAGWADEAAARLGLAVYPTRMARELRPPVPVDKGTVTESLVAGRAAACVAGDDHGDLAAFDALDRLARAGRLGHGVRIGVRSSEAPPELLARADVTVDGPQALVALLVELADAISVS